ncbi:MAG: hypothetical protein INR69_03320 [Mucilaginibacter polytrichastri]|nr:hypothetical protein [Mucilaginibacter polytrichastri]
MKKLYRTLPVLFILPLCVSCNEIKNDEQLQKRLISSTQSGKDVLDLSRLTDFSWDSMLILTPYYPVEDAAKALNVDLSPIIRAHSTLRDDLNTLVFIDNGKAVHMVSCPRSSSDFVLDTLRLIPREQAKFSINQNDPPNTYGTRWVEVKLIQ